MEVSSALKAAVVSALVVLLTGPFVIPELRKLKFGQSIREEGPKSHQAKSGTPTMGGLMILAALTAGALVAAGFEPSVLLALFGLLLLSGCRVAFMSSDGRGRLFAVGFTTLVFAHVYVNIAMSIGLVPITGLPLPLISSGRTFLVTVMCGLGIVQSVSIHREKLT